MTVFDKLRAPLLKTLRVKSTVVDGVRISTDPNCPVMRKLRAPLFKRTYEAPEREMIGNLLKPSDRVVDIGACVGLTAAICARHVGAENVRAYEANPGLETVIRANFALNGMSPDLRMRAVTADGREVTFHIAKNVFSSSIKDRGQSEPVTVNSEPIDAVLADFRPTMVLMDVEGAEDELIESSEFRGVSKILVEFHPHIIGAERVEALQGRLARIGFTEQSRSGISAAFTR